MTVTLKVRFIIIKDKICAWDMYDDVQEKQYVGSARPFKSHYSLDRLPASEFYGIPYTRKQLKEMDYILRKTDYFASIFARADKIVPDANYKNALKQTFGPDSTVCKLYESKAELPKQSPNWPVLHIDFEAMNMRICGWYGELVDEDGTVLKTYEGIAKPFNDSKMLRRIWKVTYSKLLSYDIEEIIKSPHIRTFRYHFMEMFREARKIYTYGDTDAMFVKYSFGDEAFKFFKQKNIDASVKIANRAISLDRACKLFGIYVSGDDHDPKTDVKKMQACLMRSTEL